MKPSDLREMLAAHGLDPVHARGQNFLADDHVLDAVVAAADLKPGEAVLEIGPGPGVLTEKLLAAGARVLAVEIDGRLQKLLVERFADAPGFTLLPGDILDFPSADLAARLGAGDRGYKIVANIPYQITSKILLKFLKEAPKPSQMVLMVQREVADRLAARPGDMSQIAVAAQVFAEVSKVMNVPRGAFLPPPKVDSAVISLRLKGEAEIKDFFAGTTQEKYFSLVKSAFSSPRKKIRNTLPFPAATVEAALKQIGVNPQARPEELSVGDWQNLAKVIA